VRPNCTGGVRRNGDGGLIEHIVDDKGYVTNGDDEFSADGETVYTVNAVNIVRANNQAKVTGPVNGQTLTYGTSGYTLDAATSLASIQLTAVDYNTGTKQFSVPYAGIAQSHDVQHQRLQLRARHESRAARGY
jgi:hypothetical protein